MATTKKLDNPESDSRVKAVFDDIRSTRNTDFVGNIWQYLAFDPALLEDTWQEVKSVMATESLIDGKTKEMLYVAVSIANACSYCIHSHTAAAKARGMTDTEHAELIRIVSLAAKTNHLLTGLQIPLDDVLDAAHG